MSIRSLFLTLLFFSYFPALSVEAWAAPLIDTLQITPPAPVVVDGDTVLHLYGPLGEIPATQRAAWLARRIKRLAIRKEAALPIYTDTTGPSARVFAGDSLLIIIGAADTVAAGISADSLAYSYESSIHRFIETHRPEYRIREIAIQAGLTALVVAILVLLMWLLKRLFRWLDGRLTAEQGRRISGIRIRNYTLMDEAQEMKAFHMLLRLLRLTLQIFLLYLALPFVFSIFPWTKGIADKLFSYIFSPFLKVFYNIVDYLPNLFTILVVYVIVRYTVRFLKYLAGEIERGELVISGFYADWAKPTYNIVKVLLYAFMFTVIFPYLPGSDSPIFKGVSIFLGVLISLGSSSAISNMVAGLVITYMRPFRIGDRVKIGDVTGDVLEKTMLVTRLRTIKNEEVTVPNAAVLSGYTINYHARQEPGLIMHTTVTIGYDVPWRQVHHLLVEAAMETEGLEKTPSPFVLQTSLDDFYVSYQLNAYTLQPAKQAVIYSRLHQHIQDRFNEAGVEIMSPHYRATRDGSDTTIPHPENGQMDGRKEKL